MIEVPQQTTTSGTITQHTSPTLCIAGSYFHTEKQGGVETQIYYIGKAMQQVGWNVVYLCPTTGATGWKTTNQGFQVYGFRQPNYGFQISDRQIADILGEINPDVVYQRGRTILQESGAVLRFCKHHHIPYVIALSSDVNTARFHAVFELTLTKKSWLKKLAVMPYGLWTDLKMRSTLQQADFIITQHAGQYDSLPYELQPKATILPNLHPEIIGDRLKPEKIIIAWINNYRPFKRGELFLQLAKECNDLNAQFIMVLGNAKKQYADPIIKQGKNIRNLLIYGEKTAEEIGELLSKTTLLVNTSEYEGFPNVFIQAWLQGTPTISICIDPSKALSKHHAGVVSGSFQQLVSDVRRLILAPEEVERLGRNARLFSEANHGYQHNQHRISDFFTVIAKKFGRIGTMPYNNTTTTAP